jgi:hypothetical protein
MRATTPYNTSMSDPEQTSDYTERPFMNDVCALMLDDLQGRDRIGRLDTDRPGEIDTVARFLFTQHVNDLLAHQTEINERLGNLVDQLPDEVRRGGWLFRRVLEQILEQEEHLRADEIDQAAPVVCPGGTAIDEFAPALLIAARASGYTVTGTCNNIPVITSPDMQATDVEDGYYLALYREPDTPT